MFRFRAKGLGFRVEGVQARWRARARNAPGHACVACKPTPSSHTTFNEGSTLPKCVHDAWHRR